MGCVIRVQWSLAMTSVMHSIGLQRMTVLKHVTCLILRVQIAWTAVPLLEIETVLLPSDCLDSRVRVKLDGLCKRCASVSMPP